MRDFSGMPMRQFRLWGPYVVRVFRRPRSAPQRPYGWKRWGLLAFGAGPLGVMVFGFAYEPPDREGK